MRFAPLAVAVCWSACAEPVPRLYVVQPGDTLYGLSRRFEVPVARLAADNGLDDPDHLEAGTRLVVPGTTAAADLPEFAPFPAFDHPFSPCRSARDWSPPTPERDTRPDQLAPCDRSCARSGESALCWESCDETTEMVVEQAGRRIQTWPTTGDADDPFRVREIDLDHDGVAEYFVARRVAVSNGMSVATWEAAVLRSDPTVPAVRFEVQELGDGTLVEGEGGCDLLLTEWRTLDDAFQRPGLYLVARRWQLDGAGLTPAGPLVARRYLAGFRAEVPAAPARWFDTGAEIRGTDSFDPPGSPQRWLARNPRTIAGGQRCLLLEGEADLPLAAPRHPLLPPSAACSTTPSPRASREDSGVVDQWTLEGLVEDPGRAEPMLLLGAGGEHRTLRQRHWPEAEPTWLRWGDARTGVTWPLGYSPSDPGAWLGRRVAVGEDRVVWLE